MKRLTIFGMLLLMPALALSQGATYHDLPLHNAQLDSLLQEINKSILHNLDVSPFNIAEGTVLYWCADSSKFVAASTHAMEATPKHFLFLSVTGDTVGDGVLRQSGTTLGIDSLHYYANKAAAKAAGLGKGDCYITGADSSSFARVNQ
jgi:hypothetical protein